MKKLYSILTLLLITSSIRAQQLPNSGFESWLNILGLEYPEGYLTSDMDVFGASVSKSTDKHGGQFSVKLQTTLLIDTVVVMDSVGNPIDTILQDISPIGGMTSGSINTTTLQPVFGIPFTGKPETVRLWAKASVAPGDTAVARFLLTKKLPGIDTSTVVASGGVIFTDTTDWTLYEVDLLYLENLVPDTAHFQALSSWVFPVVGNSTLLLDDLELIYNVGIENANLLNVNIYPNPSNGELFLSGSGLSGCVLRVTDATGRIIEENNLTSNSTQININQPGLFIVTATKPNGEIVLRKKVTAQ